MEKILAIAVISIVFRIISANLCGLASCRGAQHVDCIIDEEGSWNPICPENKTILNLRNMQYEILGRHNEYRNMIAGGLVNGFQPSKRMAAFIWDDTLANLAQKNVRQCEMKHDGCRNTLEFDFVGQNLAYRVQSIATTTQTNLQILLDLIDLWFSEIKDASAETISPYWGSSPTGVIGHFTQMIKDNATRVGCGAAQIFDRDYMWIYLACNYDFSNIFGYPTYQVGPTASGCRTGRDSNYTNLCSTAEQYNINKFWED